MTAKSWIGRFQRFIFASCLVWLPGMAAAVVSVGLFQIDAWKPLERLTYKTLFEIRELGILPAPKWDNRVAIIAIDEASLKAYGQFPWQRDLYAQLLQALEKSHPAAIGFDIQFIDASDKDAEFARAIAIAGNVVLARGWDNQGKVLEPIPILAAEAANQGHIAQQVDLDGITRQAPLWVNSRDFSIPGLGVAMIEVYNAYHPQKPISLPQPDQRKQFQNVWLNWPGKVDILPANSQQKSPPTYSFVDIVAGRFNPKDFHDKFVLIGLTAIGSDDPLRSPLNREPPTSGVYFHAAVIDNLLNQRLLQHPTDSTVKMFLLLLGPATNWLLLNRSIKQRLLFALTLPMFCMGIGIVVFCFYSWWIPIAASIGTMFLTGMAIQLQEQYEKQQLMQLFETHVAPETANLIWEHKEEIIQDGELEAQEMVATVLFMDIRGFTSISENLPPRELLEWLNQYLDAMSDCIMDRGGVIDKYIGDAIMAVFGVGNAEATLEQIQQDALNAIAASIDMHAKLQQLNEELQAQEKPKIQFGIGIHTGPLIAGSIGGSRRLNYSVLGDTVNIAARLESMNKELTADKPYKILLANETFDYVSDRYVGEKVTSIQLRGREQETIIYTILEERSVPVEE